MLRRVRELLDWRFLIAFAVVLTVATVAVSTYFVVLDREAKTKRIDMLVAHIERQDKESRERDRRLLQYLRTIGIDVPDSVYRTTTTTRDNDDDNDDNAGTTNITVRPETSSNDSDGGGSSPSPSPSQSNSGNGNVTDVVPEVPLPDAAGEATDTAKRIIEDVTGMVTE